jgi:mannose-6-phosphate isomerase-like protein (cupin superfamily)
LNIRSLIAGSCIAVTAFAAGALWANNPAKPVLDSRIWRAGEARSAGGSWGSIRLYTEDGTPTFGASSMLTAELSFLAGKQLQPPHQHGEEEFQYVIEGHGTWTLNGKDVPLEPGDLMYTKPWDWHGIRNSSDQPLRFFVFKWASKGTPAPPKPAG